MQPKPSHGGTTKSRGWNTIHWKAIYNDGTSLSQYTEEGENTYRDIQRDKLGAFEIWDEERLVVRVLLEANRRLICRRRHFLRAGEDMVIWLVGWQETIEGKNTQSILYILPDKTLVLGGAWDDVQLIKEEG